MMAAGSVADFLVGLAIGGLLGAALSPLLTAWLTQREWKRADRESRLSEELAIRMTADSPDERVPVED